VADKVSPSPKFHQLDVMDPLLVVDVFTKEVVSPQHTTLLVNEACGLGYTTILLDVVSEHPAAVPTKRVML
jgi:hypothetical protein